MARAVGTVPQPLPAGRGGGDRSRASPRRHRQGRAARRALEPLDRGRAPGLARLPRRGRGASAPARGAAGPPGVGVDGVGDAGARARVRLGVVGARPARDGRMAGGGGCHRLRSLRRCGRGLARLAGVCAGPGATGADPCPGAAAPGASSRGGLGGRAPAAHRERGARRAVHRARGGARDLLPTGTGPTAQVGSGVGGCRRCSRARAFQRSGSSAPEASRVPRPRRFSLHLPSPG